MSKYIIRRTSLWDDEKPCDEAIREPLTFKDERTTDLEGAKKKFWFKHFLTKCDSYEEIDGHLVGYYKRDEWTIAATIEEVYAHYGTLVVEDSECVEIPIAIEIYDSYRE